MKDVNVVKRDGSIEVFDAEKIHDVLFWASKDIKGVSVSEIEMQAKLQIYDNIPTTTIHKVLISSAVNLISEDSPNYQIVASNLTNFILRKEVFGVADNMPPLYKVITNNINNNVYDKELLQYYSEEEINEIDKFIKHNRDYTYTYAGIQQMIDKYLVQDRSTNKIYETPQYAYMLICMWIYSGEDRTKRVKKIKTLYNYLSTFKISLPTPQISGIRTPNRGFSSCTLIDIGDTLDSILASTTAIGKYTASRAGIGLNAGRIRSVGSRVGNGEVKHTGVVPFLRLFQSATRCCTQNGIRGGNSTTFFPFWHKEIEDIIVLKNNRGTDDNRVRHMDYCIQFNKLFYKRYLNNENITLFSPNQVKDLYDAFFSGDNEHFDELYIKYENDPKIDKRVISSDFFENFVRERLDTGRMYVMNADRVNEHNSYKDPIHMSNLCVEIVEPTTPLQSIDDENGEIALCVLSAVNVGVLKNLSELENICECILDVLDWVIDNQTYPIPAAKKMLKRRSVGVGMTNLAYYFAKNNVVYGSDESIELADELAESLQYYLLKASNKLAQERGKCEWFHKTMYSDGILPIDTYCKEVDNICNRKYTHDWESLRKDIIKYGLRNSVLTAQMPVESSSVVSGSTNGIEPPRSPITSKSSKKGLIPCVVPEISKLKNKYTYAFDIDNIGYNKVCAVMQKYFDQTISANHYYDPTKYPKGILPLDIPIKDIIHAYKVGLKTIYYANIYDNMKGSEDIQTEESGCASGSCTL